MIAERRLPAQAGTRADLLLVCSSGGHLLELLALQEAWRDLDRLWVTFDRSDARSLLSDERVLHAYWPTDRNIPNLIRNLLLAWKIVRRSRPRTLVTTGAGVAVPFVWVARLHRIRTIYIESMTRLDQPSLTLKLIRPAVDRVYVQWPELVARVPRARYEGNIFGREL